MSSTPKLILIEGIPGSGKTTCAQFTANWLVQNGIASRLYLEGDFDHPADYESVACLTPLQLEEINARFPGQQEAVKAYSTWRGNEVFVKFIKMQRDLGSASIPDLLVQEMGNYEVYNGLSLEDFSRVSQAYWSEFSAAAQVENLIYIFECCFLQNAITNFLGRHNSDSQLMRSHLAQIGTTIQPLQPALVYLDPGNIYATLQHAVDSRPAEWYDHLKKYILEQGFGKANQLEGLDGISRFYDRMREIQREFLQTWTGPLLYLENAQNDWPTAYQKITNFYSEITAG